MKLIYAFKSGVMDEYVIIFSFNPYEAVASVEPSLYNTFQLLHLLVDYGNAANVSRSACLGLQLLFTMSISSTVRSVRNRFLVTSAKRTALLMAMPRLLK